MRVSRDRLFGGDMRREGIIESVLCVIGCLPRESTSRIAISHRVIGEIFTDTNFSKINIIKEKSNPVTPVYKNVLYIKTMT